MRAYLNQSTRHRSKLIPYDDLAWTGRYVIETIDGETTISVERKVCLFNLHFLPLFRWWEKDCNIVIREEESIMIHRGVVT